MAQRFFTLVFLFICTLLPAQASLFSSKTQFVPVDQAFAFDFKQQEHKLDLNWQIKPGYYLYRQQIKIEPHQAKIAPFTLPEGLDHHDEFYGKTAIFKNDLTLNLRLQNADQNATLVVTYQGCAEAGFCYPPETKTIPLDSVVAQAITDVVQDTAPNTESAPALPFSPLWALLIGSGIAFTPCILPMYPLISAIILGQDRQQSYRRIFVLSLVYVQGMAVTYTLLGMVVAAAGLQFQAAFQHPYVLIGLSILFVLLALSMFGLFTLQLPSSVQTRLTLWSNQQRSGSLIGVFVMGALAGLICSPCTTAPLSAILLYIAQSGNMAAGGGTLYLYALGMGIPLILVTTFGNRLLPRSGPWMQYVKEAFGFVILALPVFLLERILGDEWGLRLWSLLGVAFFGWAFALSLKSSHRLARIMQIVMLGLALVCSRPLQDWAFGNASQATIAHLSFQKVNTVAELDHALQQAKAENKPVMLDLYADWCVACKEFEKYTFSDPTVRQQLADTVLLQADVTANSAEHAALLKHLNVLGLPTILFYNAQAQEQPQLRVTGFMNAKEFTAHLHNR